MKNGGIKTKEFFRLSTTKKNGKKTGTSQESHCLEMAEKRKVIVALIFI